MKTFSIVLLFSAFTFSMICQAEEPKDKADQKVEAVTESPDGLHLLSFRLAGLYVSQPSNDPGASYTGILSWNPHYDLDRWRFGLGIGGTMLKGIADDRFILGEGIGTVSFRTVKNLAVEAVGGVQFWMDNMTVKPVFGGNLAYGFDRPILFVLDTVFTGYVYCPVSSTNPTHEFRLGVGIGF